MKYFLYSNHFASSQNMLVAKVTQQETVSFDDIVKKATRRGLTLTDSELISAITEITYTIIEELNNGKAVDTPFARYRPSISGVFTSKDDAFDDNRHSIKVNCLVGRDIKIDLNRIVLERVKYTNPNPSIDCFFDYHTQEENRTISPGSTAEITGELLKINKNDEEQGLFFINGTTITKVKVIIHNMPSKIIFNIPANLVPGAYHLEIRNKTHKNDHNIKTYFFPSQLTVR